MKNITFFTFMQKDKNRKLSSGKSVSDMFDSYAKSSSYSDASNLKKTNIKHCSKTYDASKFHYNPENGYNVTYNTLYDENKQECYLRKLKTYQVPLLSHTLFKNNLITYAIDKNTRIVSGYLQAKKEDARHIYISEIFIHKNYRGNDLCGKLISKFVEYIERNIPNIYIYILIDATATVNSGHQIGDFCYNRTFARLGYVRDLRTDILKIFTKSEKIDTKNEMIKYNKYLKNIYYI